MRSWVWCGIDFAAGERLITSDTVAGESPRCSAKNFKLTDRAEVFPRGREVATVFDRVMGCFVRVVSHKDSAGASIRTHFSARGLSESHCFSSRPTLRQIDLLLHSASTCLFHFVSHSA